MFYDVDMLRRGGKFAIIWLASSGHHLKDGKILAKHRRDALKVNVLKTVADLQEHIIPNNDPNCPSQFSLYLAARLCHGTIAVHAFQVKHAVKNFCDHVYRRPRKMKPGNGQALDCPINTAPHNPNLKRCRCQKCATTIDYGDEEFGQLIEQLIREETEGLRVTHPDDEKNNAVPVQLISEWLEEDEAKFIKDLEEAFENAGTKVKDVSSITLPETLDFVSDNPVNEDELPDVYQSRESFLENGEDRGMLTDHLNTESEFYIGQPRGDPGPRIHNIDEPMDLGDYQEIARENDEEMEIGNQDTDIPSRGKRPGVREVGGPSSPKKPKPVNEGENNFEINFPVPEGFPEQEVPVPVEDLAVGEAMGGTNAVDTNADVPNVVDPRMAGIEMEPVNDEQLPKRRRHQRRALIVDEETQLTVAEMADQRQNYHYTMRVLNAFEDVVISPRYPRATAEKFFTRPSVIGTTRRTLGELVTRHFNVPRNQPDSEDYNIPIAPVIPGTPVEQVIDAPPTNDVNVAGAKDDTNGPGGEANFGPFPEHGNDFEGTGADASQHMPESSPGALRSASRSRLSALFTVPNSANHSTGGTSNVGQSSSGTSGTVTSVRPRAPAVSTVPEVSQEISTTSSRRTQQGRSKSRGTGATQACRDSEASTTEATPVPLDPYAWLDELAGLNVSGFEPEEVVLEPEPEPDGLPELRVENVVSRIRSLVEEHGNQLTFTILMPPAEHNEHEAAQMFYFLLKLQRDGIVDLHQEEFVYPQEPGDIFIRLLE